MPTALRSDGADTLLLANDETATFNLNNTTAVDSGQLQIDAGAEAGGGTSILDLYVKVESAAGWALEPTTINMAAGQSLVIRVPRYLYAKVKIRSTSDATMAHTVYFR